MGGCENGAMKRFGTQKAARDLSKMVSLLTEMNRTGSEIRSSTRPKIEGNIEPLDAGVHKCGMEFEKYDDGNV